MFKPITTLRMLVLAGIPVLCMAQTPDPAAAVQAPPDVAAEVEWNASSGIFRLKYNGEVVLDGKVEGQGAELSQIEYGRGRVEQHIRLTGKGLSLTALAHGSEQTLAAETRGGAQMRFPMVRTSHGMSDNRRNNAIYDRKWDRQIEIITAVRISPAGESASSRDFKLTAIGDFIEIAFRPHFYQRHKGIEFFEPWTYKVRDDSITGWSSGWAYKRAFGQKECDALLEVLKEKRMNDFGYRFIQIDDGFQNELGKGQDRPRYPGANKDYPSRGPDTWLKWRKDTFPAGLPGFVTACKTAGFEPAMWVGPHFTDNTLINNHPDWFIRGKDGKPFAAPWISCGVDATREKALDGLVRPTYEGIKNAGVSYVKIDLLRHYFYDLLNKNQDYCREHGVTSAQMYRKFLTAVRKALGPDTFILSSWGVLPESASLVDACRLAGDGYGPGSMQQYNCWNGIVWRNDPDHCDVYPQFKGVGTGNVTKFESVVPTNNDTVIRPALASIAGTMLILSDKPDVYRDDRNIEGARRSSPIVSSVPGQLYNFDESKSGTLVSIYRDDISSGTDVAPGDANQFGEVCPWWLNEFNIAGVGQWNVLHRVNWGKEAPAVAVDFSDMGLEADADYLVYEFWTHEYLGVKRGLLELPAAGQHELRSYALRKLENHPQIVSTNRHLSQGGVDLLEVSWQDGVLSGKSKVVVGDRYELALHVPAGFVVKSAIIGGKSAQTEAEGELLRVSFTPDATGEVAWRMEFETK